MEPALALIIGVFSGLFAILIVIIALSCYYMRKYKKEKEKLRQQEAKGKEVPLVPSTSASGNRDRGQGGSTPGSALPRYGSRDSSRAEYLRKSLTMNQDLQKESDDENQENQPESQQRIVVDQSEHVSAQRTTRMKKVVIGRSALFGRKSMHSGPQSQISPVSAKGEEIQLPLYTGSSPGHLAAGHVHKYGSMGHPKPPGGKGDTQIFMGNTSETEEDSR